MADEIRINGNAHSWASIKVKCEGDLFTGFTAISYADKLEVAKLYGMGKSHAPRGRTRGKYSTEPAKLSGPKSTMKALRDALAKRSPSGKSYGQTVFQIVVQYVEANDKPQTDELIDCRYIGTTSSHEESPDPLVDEVEIDVMRIRRDGQTLYEEQAQ